MGDYEDTFHPHGTDGDDVEDNASLLGGVTSISFDWNNNMIDTTNNDDAGYTSNEYGNQSASLSVDCIYDPSDTAQAAVLSAVKNKTKILVGYHPIVANGEDMYIFSSLVESSPISGGNDEVVTVSFTFTSTGTITVDAPNT